jgi:hypothetical protein
VKLGKKRKIIEVENKSGNRYIDDNKVERNIINRCVLKLNNGKNGRREI